MWICRICDHKTGRRGNIIRHLKLVHYIDDRDGKNIYKETNTGVNSYGESRKDTLVCSNGLQTRMLGSGIPLSERKTEEGRHLPRRPQMMEEDYSEEDEARTSPVDGLYPPKQIEEFDDDMRIKKCHILDCVLDTFPEHLKTKAKNMCDTLKCKSRISILPSHEIVIDGVVDRGSNIRDYIMDSLIEPPVPGTPKFTMLEKENERLKRNLAYYEKALAKARGVSRCRKFESIIDGSMERCEFSDETNSDESDGDESDSDESDGDGSGEDDDGTGEDDESDDEDDDGVY